MTILSQQPLIQMEETSEMTRTLFFCVAEIDTNPDLYRQTAGDLHTRSAGEITVYLNDLPYGRIKIVRNPSAGDQYEDLEFVVETICGRLRAACATCPDFNPGFCRGEGIVLGSSLADGEKEEFDDLQDW